MAKKGIDPLVAGVTGAAIGAMAGAAMADEKMRKKIGKAIERTRQRGEVTLHEIRRGGLKKKLPKLGKKKTR